MEVENRTKCKSILIGTVLISIALLFVFIDNIIGIIFRYEFQENIKDIITSIYAIYIGFLFLLSYYYENESFLFKALIWFCKHIGIIRGKKLAFFFFALGLIIGIQGILQTLGIFNFGKHN